MSLLWPYCRPLIKTMLISRWSGLNFNSKMFRQDEKPVPPLPSPPPLSPDSSPSLPKKNYLGMERKANEASSAFIPLNIRFRKCYISNFLTNVKNTYTYLNKHGWLWILFLNIPPLPPSFQITSAVKLISTAMKIIEEHSKKHFVPLFLLNREVTGYFNHEGFENLFYFFVMGEIFMDPLSIIILNQSLLAFRFSIRNL